MRSVDPKKLEALLLSLLTFLIGLRGIDIIGGFHNNLGYLSLTNRSAGPLMVGCIVAASAPNVESSEATLSAALVHFQEALSLNRGLDSAMIGLGLIDCMHDQLGKALDRWALISESNGRNSWYLAMGLLHRGANERATTVLIKDAQGELFARKLIESYRKYARIENALPWGEILIRISATRPNLETAADLYLELGRTSDAVDLWASVLPRLAEASPDYWWALAETARLGGDWNDARNALVSGAKLAADPHPFYERLGLLERDLGNWRAALEAFRLAIESQPDNQYGYLLAGDMQRELGNFDAAFQLYSSAAILSPSSSHADIRIGVLRYRQRQYGQAMSYLEDALEKNMLDPVARYYMALVFHDMGQHSRARSELEAAASMANNPDWWSLLASWFEEAELEDQAAEALKRSNALRP